MKFTKLAAAVSAVAVASAAFAVAASAETTVTENAAEGTTTVSIGFNDMAKSYSDYLDDNGKLNKVSPYDSSTFGELPGYYGFYPNLAVDNGKDYITSECIRTGGPKGLNKDQTSINANGDTLKEGRYIKFIPEYDCSLTVTGAPINSSSKIDSNKVWYIGSDTSKGSATSTISCKKGNEYYIYSNASGIGVKITSLSYTYTTPVTTHSSMFEFKGDGTFTSIKATAKKGEQTDTKSTSLDKTVTLGEGSSFYLTISDVPNDVEITNVTAE